jgi:hypothetical protein
MRNLLNKIVAWAVFTIGKVHWTAQNTLEPVEQNKIRDLLVNNYYIILTHRNNHLSTFFTGLVNFFLSGKWGYWAHALMNLEDQVNQSTDFRLVEAVDVKIEDKTDIKNPNERFIEAVSAGVKYTPFNDVFDVHGVVLLKPKNMSIDRWTCVLDRAKSELGKPYDTLFNIAEDNALSCVELVRTALMAEPDYAVNFANFEALIKKHKNLAPQMYYDCGDFEIVYEIRRK